MKYLLILVALALVSYQGAYARCTGNEASHIIKEVYGYNDMQGEIKLSGISPKATEEVSAICMSGCYLNTSPECNKRYAEVIKKYSTTIYSAIKSELTQKQREDILNKYLEVSVDLKGCEAIGDYQRSIVNPSQIAKCGSQRKAVLCKIKIKCDAGSEIAQQQGSQKALIADLNCIGDEMGNCPNLKTCFEDDTVQKFDIENPVKIIESQSRTSKQ